MDKAPASPPTPLSPPKSANEFIERQLDERIREIENAYAAHAIAFSGPLVFGVDDLIRTAAERRRDEQPRRRKLVVILTTTGGYLDPVHRMVETLRYHYRIVDFIIPNYAYSAGTVWAMSGDAIHMDYYSRLGPIDPQVENQRGIQVPALGYLEKYNELLEKARKGKITGPEIMILVQSFDQAELHSYEEARELSVALLKEWLVKYKFKNWKITRTRKQKVTRQMKLLRAESIARKLNDTKKWHTHGYGISRDVLDKDLNLLIDDFGSDGRLSGIIRTYHDLLADYMMRLGISGVVHFDGSFKPFMAERR